MLPTLLLSHIFCTTSMTTMPMLSNKTCWFCELNLLSWGGLKSSMNKKHMAKIETKQVSQINYSSAPMLESQVILLNCSKSEQQAMRNAMLDSTCWGNHLTKQTLQRSHENSSYEWHSQCITGISICNHDMRYHTFKLSHPCNVIVTNNKLSLLDHLALPCNMAHIWKMSHSLELL